MDDENENWWDEVDWHSACVNNNLPEGFTIENHWYDNQGDNEYHFGTLRYGSLFGRFVVRVHPIAESHWDGDLEEFAEGEVQEPRDHLLAELEKARDTIKWWLATPNPNDVRRQNEAVGVLDKLIASLQPKE